MVTELEEVEKKRKCTESEKHGIFTNDFAAFFELLSLTVLYSSPYLKNVTIILIKNCVTAYLHLKKTTPVLSDLLLV